MNLLKCTPTEKTTFPHSGSKQLTINFQSYFRILNALGWNIAVRKFEYQMLSVLLGSVGKIRHNLAEPPRVVLVVVALHQRSRPECLGTYAH